MSTAVLSSLRDYLYGTLSPANMLWLSQQLAEYAVKQQQEEAQLPFLPQTKDEINRILDEREARIAAGVYVEHEEVMRWIDAELAEEEEQQLEMPVAV